MKRLIFLGVILLSACAQEIDGGFKGSFKHTPLTIKYQYFDTSGLTLNADALPHAVEFWNVAAGKEILIIRQDINWQDADIMVSVVPEGVSSENLDASSTVYDEAVAGQLGQVVLRYESGQGLTREIGHILGFEYIGGGGGVMDRLNTNEQLDSYITSDLLGYLNTL